MIANIPSVRYTSRDFMEAERSWLWCNTWLVAGFASDVTSAGDYFVFELGDESVLVVRTTDGVTAFHNVCMHRGHILCEAARGHRASFVCPYHSWVWTLDGRLSHVPLAGEFPVGIPREFRHLLPVACRVWAGLVWVCLNEPRQPLDEFFGASAGRISATEIASLELVEDRTLPMESNWKTTADRHVAAASGLYVFPNILLTTGHGEAQLLRVRPDADDPKRALLDVFRLAAPAPLRPRPEHAQLSSFNPVPWPSAVPENADARTALHLKIDSYLGDHIPADARLVAG